MSDDPEHRYPTPFGRGWIPLSRDIGVPGDDLGWSAVAPAEAGAYPGSPRRYDAGFDGEELDGPLPDLRSVYPERPAFRPAEGRGRRDGVGYGGGALALGRLIPPVPLHHASQGPPPRAGEELLPLHHPADGPPSRAELGEDLRGALHHNAFTPERRVRFLDALAGRGSVRGACAAVGVSAQTAYVAKRRDAAFAQGWAAALVLARDHVGDVLGARAIEGIAEDVYFRGELVGTRVRHDTRLLLAHMARLDRIADETAAGALAGRFDELLALVAGARPDSALYAFFDPERKARRRCCHPRAQSTAPWPRSARMPRCGSGRRAATTTRRRKRGRRKTATPSRCSNPRTHAPMPRTHGMCGATPPAKRSTAA